jgi:poly-gamma-glutamate capsule biosynthesis protein CapA/YwtB (metallophosphatase superfamily)
MNEGKKVRTGMNTRFGRKIAFSFRWLCILSLTPWVLPVSQAVSEKSASYPKPTLRIRAVGTVMPGTDYPSEEHLPPNDGRDYFDEVRALLSDADLTFANLEAALCDSGETWKSRYRKQAYAFRTPRRYGRYLKDGGIDLVSIANNHARDFGEDGLVSTTSLLDSLGIAWSGPVGTYASLERNGLRVGMIAFHTACHSNYMNDLETAERLVRRVDAGHDVVLISFHGGAEGNEALHVPNEREFFCDEDRGHVRLFARRMVDAGADLVLGHGPHVPRGMETYRNRLIAYSLGNFATYGRFCLKGARGTGLVLEAILDDEGCFIEGRILPTRQIDRGIPIRDHQGRATALVRKLSIEDFLDTSVLISRNGRILERFRPDLRSLRKLSPDLSPVQQPVVISMPEQ